MAPFPPSPSPPPYVPPPPAPPPPSGLLYEIFRRNPKYSTFYQVIQPYAKAIENVAKRKSLTILAPNNNAMYAFADVLDVGLSLMPSDRLKAQFLERIVFVHTIVKHFTWNELAALRGKLKTLLGKETLTVVGRRRLFGSGVALWQQARAVEANLHLKAPPQRMISVQGIQSVIFPRHLSNLYSKDLYRMYRYGSDPAPPKIAITPAIQRSLNILYGPVTVLWQVDYLFSTSIRIFGKQSCMGGPPSCLWPYLATQKGVTVLVPTNAAYNVKSTAVAFYLVREVLTPASAANWLVNLAKFHVISRWEDQLAWEHTTSGTGIPTLLQPTVLFFAYNKGASYWFSNLNVALKNATNALYPNLQASFDTTFSIQGVNNVLSPRNKQRLLPPSAIPIGKK